MHNLYPLPPQLPTVSEAIEFGQLALKVIRGQATADEGWECVHFAWHLAGCGIKLKHPHEPVYVGSDADLTSGLEAFLASKDDPQRISMAFPWGLVLAVAVKVLELWLSRRK